MTTQTISSYGSLTAALAALSGGTGTTIVLSGGIVIGTGGSATISSNTTLAPCARHAANP